MKLHLLAVGQRMPDWVEAGFREYAQRLPRECSLELHEIAPGKRGKGLSAERAMREEGERLLAALPRNTHIVTLEVNGRAWSTEQLAEQLAAWMGNGRDIALLVGGPDGLAPEVLTKAHQRWSLSNLTLPHPLVRVLLAEQLYRAWSILNNHPYHRA